tara:strand:- start:1733 stop:2098 length:366 start_codon:yes stop_codon:yes gene_type:complete
MQAEFYDSLLPLNIIGGYNAIQAAHQARCEHIVFASSVNAVLGHGGVEPVSWDVPVHPFNVYGATKCWGESLARVYLSQHNLSTICIRLGSPPFQQDGDFDADEPNLGISPRRNTAWLFFR